MRWGSQVKGDLEKQMRLQACFIQFERAVWPRSQTEVRKALMLHVCD